MVLRTTVAGFDWDTGNGAKCVKHGVTVADLEGAFRGDMHILPDPEHSKVETRQVGIGKTLDGRHIFVAFTLRSRDGARFIRPISARFMHAKEVTYYETEIAKATQRSTGGVAGSKG